MAATERYAGTGVYISFGGQDISGDWTSIDINEEGDHVDVTAGTETVHYYLPLRANATFDFEMFWNGGTAQTETDAVAVNTVGTLIIGPYGTVATYPRIICTRALVKSRKLSLKFDGDGFKLGGSFQASAAVTRDNFS